MKCNYRRWLWGILPIVILCLAAVHFERGRIEQDLAERAGSALTQGGSTWALAAFEGRDVVLSGRAPDEDGPGKASDTLQGVWGVRIVDNRAGLLEPSRDRALLERPFGFPVPGIVESDELAPGALSPGIEPRGLGAGHVGLEAAEPDDGRAVAFPDPNCDPARCGTLAYAQQMQHGRRTLDIGKRGCVGGMVNRSSTRSGDASG